MSQISVALSLKPKFDHTKWLGKKEKVRTMTTIKFSLYFSLSCSLAIVVCSFRIKKMIMRSAQNPYIDATNLTSEPSTNDAHLGA